VSKKQAATLGDVSLSPYLSFRQAIRPAIFANRLLLREEERAGELAGAANQILALTRDLLMKAGLGYIASAGPGSPIRDGGGLGRLDSLLDAFADAAMMWTQIVGGCVAIADRLLGQDRVDEVEALAAVLDDAGEAGTAQELRQRLAIAAMDRYKKRLDAIHPHMKRSEVANAITALREAVSEIPQSRDRDIWLNSFLPALAKSALTYIEESEDYDEYEGITAAVIDIANGNLTHTNVVATSVSDIAAAFRAAKSRRQ
jgi:hypothetical protein